MGLNLGQSQVGDVLEQRLDAFVFAHPLLDLRKQLFGDIHRAGFTLCFKGQVMAQVAFTGLAVAAGAAAFSAEGDEAGGHQGAVQFELFDARGQVAADQRGMFGQFHTRGG